MSAVAVIRDDLATTRVLWLRDLLRFLRQPSRIVGALGQPIIFWLVIGAGLGPSFQLAGAAGTSYLEYFYPGIIVMVVLFASIFATVSVIEDRHAGFLQGVLVAPGSRLALVIGKSLGAATVALVQAALFLALLPLAGFHFSSVDWGSLAALLVLTSLGLTAFGFTLAWWLDNLQAYHAIQMTLLVPLWVLSGAMFPPSDRHPVFAAIMRMNPMSYATSGIRQALYGGAAPPPLPTIGTSLLVSGALTFAALVSATWLCYRRRA